MEEEKSSFLWINKTATSRSLTNSRGGQLSQILQHVKRGRSTARKPVSYEPRILPWRPKEKAVQASPVWTKNETPKPRKRPLMLLPGSLVGPSENDGLMSDDDSEQSQKLSINEIVSILDPFCRLPFKLSKEEALYLKFYLTTVCFDLYGTRPDPMFSPVREVSLDKAAISAPTLQWMIISAQWSIAQKSGNKEDPHLSFFQRKAKAYRDMNRQLGARPSGDKVPEEVIYGIIMLLITESRGASPRITKIHLKAYEIAVETRGGIDEMIRGSPLAPFEYAAHLMPYLVSQPEMSDVVFHEPCAGDAVHILQRIAIGEVDTSAFADFENILVSPHDGLSDPPAMKELFPQDLHEILTSRPISTYLQAETSSRPYLVRAAHFISLFILVSTLWKLRGESPLQIKFLNRLSVLIAKSTARDAAGSPLLTIQGFFWLVVKAGFDVYDGLKVEAQRSSHQVDLLVDAILALKLFRLVCESIREEFVLLLRRYLLD